MKKLILLLGMLAFFSCRIMKTKEIASSASGEQKKTAALDSIYQPSANGINGKALFRANCASCHQPSEKRFVGPGLKGAEARMPGGNWKYDFIHDSQKLIKAGDAYSNAVSKEFNGVVMPAFPKLTNEEIDEILRYCNY